MEGFNEESIYRQIVDKAGDAIIFADSQGNIQLWNAGAERIFGFTREEVLGKSMEVIIPPNLRERHWQGYRETMRTGHTRYANDVLSVPAIRKDGSRISIQFTVALIQDSEGKPLGVAAIVRDVTVQWNERKELQKRLAELEAKLAQVAPPAKV